MYDFNVTGTYIWYYCICKREVWLLAHGIEADQQNELLQTGKIIHEDGYRRNRKEFEFGDSKFDIIKNKNGKLIVGEIKKSSTFIESARMQLLFYLMQLEETGIHAEGELLFPEEKKKESIVLDDNNREKLKNMIIDIESIARRSAPEPPVKVKYCKKCAYSEFCWA